MGPLETLVVPPIDAVYLSEAVDLDADPSRPVETPAPPTQIGELVYSADVGPADPNRATWEDHAGFEVRVTVRNPGPDMIGLVLAGCPVRGVAYRTPERTGEPAWEWRGECQSPSSIRPLAPGDSVVLADYLGAGALDPDGRYYFTAELHLQGDTLALDAGSVDVQLTVPGLEYALHVGAGDGRTLRGEIVVTNRRTDVVEVTFGACATDVLIYADAARTRLERRWLTDPDVFCPGALRSWSPDPGESFTWSVRRSLATLGLGGETAGFSPGLYHLSLTLWLNGRAHEFPAGPMYVR